MKRSLVALALIVMLACEQPSNVTARLAGIIKTAQIVLPLIPNLTADQQAKSRQVLNAALTCVEASASILASDPDNRAVAIAQACAAASATAVPAGLPQAAASALAAVLQAVQDFMATQKPPAPVLTGKKAAPDWYLSDADRKALPKIAKQATEMRGKL